MVQNLPSWMTVGHRKTKELPSEWLTSFWFSCPIASFAIQLGKLCTMLPSHAKGLMKAKPHVRKKNQVPCEICFGVEL